MHISHIELLRWKNFQQVDVNLSERVFLVGPNAVGKSNFLDALRFLRDLAAPGGGLQRAVAVRGGEEARLQNFGSPAEADIGMTVALADNGKRRWRYEVRFRPPAQGQQAAITHEAVRSGGRRLLTRPDKDDERDPVRLTQTALEQVNINSRFRPIAAFLSGITYLHLVPQLVRSSEDWGRGDTNGGSLEAYGRNFLERISKTETAVRQHRLHQISEIVEMAAPQLKRLRLERLEGEPHLIADQSGPPEPGRLTERQFSDGTLRLIGLLWALQDGKGPVLLEEPELSLHTGVIRPLPRLIFRMQRAYGRQVIISTHSAELLADPGIGGEEVLLLAPGEQGTRVTPASALPDIRALLEAGMTAADAIVPRTVPAGASRIDLIEPRE